MSMLSAQSGELREAADRLEGYQNGDIRRMLCEAADTIEGLRGRLQESEAAMNKAAGNWAKADAQLRESYGKVPEQGKRENGDERESYQERTRAAIDDWMAVKDGRKSRWHQLFGTPERAARTIMHKQLTHDLLEQCDECPYQADECFEPSGKCAMDDHDTLLKWLRGDAE